MKFETLLIAVLLKQNNGVSDQKSKNIRRNLPF